MTLVLDKFRTLLPRTKTSPSGWLSFNAPCCHHRGHGRDERKRGGIIFNAGVSFHCFNCKFTAHWEPGRTLSDKFKTLCRWLGGNEDDIKQLVFEALKTESIDYQPVQFVDKARFTEKELPKDAKSLYDWAHECNGLSDDLLENLQNAVQYIIDRGFDPNNKNFYWSPCQGYQDRVIISFTYEGKPVGNTARKINKGKPKYLSDHHPQFVFNVDAQKEDSRYIFVVEGPFDALAIDGVALLTNDISDQQARIIDSLGKEVIVIPDQDKAGLGLVDRAMHYNWAVAFPTWSQDIKDCADAVQKYGKLFVLVDAIKTAQKGEIRLEIARRKLENNLRSYDV